MLDKDLYEILGVKADATDTQIRKTFRELAKKYHPDVNPGNQEAERKFKEINFAYEVLKDPKKRAQYDQMKKSAYSSSIFKGGRSAESPFTADFFGDLGLGDLFNELFGGGFARSGQKQRRSPFGGGGGGFGGFSEKGADREAELEITFLEAAKGAEKILELPGGKKVTVKIPEGVDTGSKIKLSGQGEPSFSGGPSGDLILTLQILPHPSFKREGHHLILALPITFSEAVLGCELEIPTVDGKAQLKIPKGISSGQRLKLSHKGILDLKTQTKGHLFVEVLIKIPKNPDDSYMAAAEILKKSSFNPRD